MAGRQTANGKAFEYAFLKAMYDKLETLTDVEIEESAQLLTARTSYNEFENTDVLDEAARAGMRVIYRLEPRLHNGNAPLKLVIQPDRAGQEGDVRDVVAIRSNEGWEIGISCKHNHVAVKHSRLSATIDVGRVWFDLEATPEYMQTVRTIFGELGVLREQGVLWREVEDKANTYYVPVLSAFMDELKRLDALHPGEIPKRLISYLLGRNDFYKAIAKTTERNTAIQGFNLYGTLNMPTIDGEQPQLRTPRVRMPSRFFNIGFKPGSNTTIEIICDEGWAISCRIHSAATRVENSLKLDVQLTGVPTSIHQHTEAWNQ